VVIFPFKIKLEKTMEFELHPKLKKFAKKIGEDEGLYLIYFGCLTIFSNFTLKIFPDKD
jgi:hypothetical protein